MLQSTESFFFNLIFILYWSIVDLQYCVSFRCTAKFFGYTYINSFSDSFPIQVVIGYGVEFPVLCSCFPLAIYFTFGSVYMSVLLSLGQDLLPPSPGL